jgi:pimeloyl-ACP methyl ester carboxylesterase
MTLTLKTTPSRDGTKVAYYQIGTGPGIIILHGAMQHGLSHYDLAASLSKKFTCYLPDRRGRGRSGPTGKGYSVEKEVEDVEAIHTATGARFIFGVSSGAWITLKATLAAPTSHIEKVAVFEPPWWPESERQAQQSWTQRFEQEVHDGHIAEAAVTAMLGAQMGPAVFQSKYFPCTILVLLTKLMMRMDRPVGVPVDQPTDCTESEQEPLFKDLVPTFRNDIAIAMNMLGEKNLQTLANIQTKTLILGGSKSPAYLGRSVRELEKILPNAHRVEIKGIDHGGASNKAQRGSPDIVAGELTQFFLENGIVQDRIA